MATQWKCAERLTNAISRAAKFSQLGVSMFSRFRWAMIGAFHNRFAMPPARALLMGPHAFRSPTRTGGRLSVGFRDFDDLITFEAVFMWHHYPLEIVGFEPDTIIDCGAHVGFFTCLASATFPNARLICLEPNPNNYARLSCHVRQNGISAQLIEAAASTEEGLVSFVGGGFRGAVVPDERQDSIGVRAVCFNDIIREQRSEALVVKMDVEGAEHQLLPALVPILPEKSAVFLEWHGNRASWIEAMEMMSRAGFKTEITLDNTSIEGGEAVAAFVRRNTKPVGMSDSEASWARAGTT